MQVLLRVQTMDGMRIGKQAQIGGSLGIWLYLAAALLAVAAAEPKAEEAKALIPWDEIDPEQRTKIEEVVDQPTVYHRSRCEVFESSPELYLLLLEEPVLTFELWKSVGVSDAKLKEVSRNRFEGSDGHASEGRWEFVHKSPRLKVIYAEGQYRGPLLGSTLETRSVLVLRTAFFEERDGKKYVKHQLDGFVKAESGSLKPLTKALRPVFQKSVEATMQETLWFVSLMCRYTMHDPHAVAQAVENAENVPDAAKARMRKILQPILAATPPRKEPAPDDAPNR